MSGFNRPLLYDAFGLPRQSRSGDGFSANLAPVIQATDSNQTFAVAGLASGLYVRNGMTAARTDTTDTAALILAAYPNMDIGDSFVVAVSVGTAFAWNIAAGTGVTLVGKTQIPASGFGFVLFTKTSATTMTAQVL